MLGGRQVRLEKPLGRRQRRHLLRLPLELLREQPRVISPRAQLGLRGVPLLLQRGQLRLGRLAPALRLVEPRLERARLAVALEQALREARDRLVGLHHLRRGTPLLRLRRTDARIRRGELARLGLELLLCLLLVSHRPVEGAL